MFCIFATKSSIFPNIFSSKRASKWFMTASMSDQYFSSSLSKEGAQYYGAFTFLKYFFQQCGTVVLTMWRSTDSLVTYVDTFDNITLPNGSTYYVEVLCSTKYKNILPSDKYDADNNDADDNDDENNVDEAGFYLHLLPAVRRQVEGEHCEEGDSHAGDDQVHLNFHIVDGDGDGDGDGNGYDDSLPCKTRSSVAL